MLITRKIEIEVKKRGKERHNTDWQFIHFLNQNIYKAANDIVTYYYFNRLLKEKLRVADQGYKELRKKMKLLDEKLSQRMNVKKRKDLLEEKKTLHQERNKYEDQINRQFS